MEREGSRGRLFVSPPASFPRGSAGPAARAETDPAKRKVVYDAVQKTLACTGPAVVRAYGTIFTAMARDVQGFSPMPTRALTYLRETKLGR